MTDKDKNILRERIQKKIERMKNQLVELKDQTKPIAPENAIGRISRMDAINNKSVAEAAMRMNQEKLKELQSNLEMIDEKEFGKCISCGKEIKLGRLMALPESKRCVKCA
jgi:DnaK suppressor protein